MAFFSNKLFAFAVSALLLSLSLNVGTLWLAQDAIHTSDTHYSYVGDDYPNQLPIHLDSVGLSHWDSEHYPLSSHRAFIEWQSMDFFPRSFGFVRLGPNGRKFGVAMFHQMHCLNMIRQALVEGESNGHVQHCFNLLRQMILCAADTTLAPVNAVPGGPPAGTTGAGITNVCRDWTQVYDFVTENQKHWPRTNGTGAGHAAHTHM
ncbi:hypothetical protein BOTBODRAFT_39499 [Botryobasidium botryosum FD-172 SS1]|uniref:Oxidase ustYa n=1 Tax=Botryobasidium botryosum (strain FD-172 SS1) TaxID=930990 RepID=A0A067M3X7_BOTB1|nr:hypothetical protein BOTBODRAFT_39499 [Botryobasidium botryosum FD-172 SS1]